MDAIKLKNIIYKFLENENQLDLNYDINDDPTYFEEIKGSSKKNSSNIYRPRNYELNRTLEKIKGFLDVEMSSKYELFCFFCKYYYNKEFLGERKKEIRDNEVVLGEYTFKTYEEIKNEVEIFASALYQFEEIEYNIFDDNGIHNKLKILGIWSKNRIEWFTTDMACSAIDFVTVPIYDTMGINSVIHIFKITKMRICCIEAEKLECLIKIKDELENLNILIIYDEWSLKEDLKKKANEAGYKVYFYKDLIDNYKNKNIIPQYYHYDKTFSNGHNRNSSNEKNNSDDNKLSTNNKDDFNCENNYVNNISEKKNKIRKMSNENEEKEKMNDKNDEENIIENNREDINEKNNNISKNNMEEIDENLVNNIKKNKNNLNNVCTIIFTSGSSGTPKGAMITHYNFITFIQSYLIDCNRLGLKKYDIIFSYLPLAHVYERFIEFAVCFFGAKIGYFSGNVKELLNDMNELKPTFLITVPRILQKFHDNIMEGLKNKSFVTRMLVKTAIKNKKNIYLKNSKKFHHKVYDLILQPIRNKFGGNIRTQVMGSSSMDRNKLIDLQMIFSSPITEGWGMTEVGISFLQNRFDKTKGTIGGPFSNVVFKVVKVENMKYNPKEYPNKGELCINGSSIMAGYFRNEELNKKSFDEDGFFFTGDVVEVSEKNEYVRIIDRAKNIFKLAQGEYIEPEKLENIYSNSFYIDNIFVHGYSYENELVSIIVPNESSVLDYAKKNNLNLPYEELLKSDAIHKLFFEELLNISKVNNLNGIEKIRLFHLTHIPFSIYNKQLTPTHKIVRNVILKDYETIINDLYENRKK
ncbi:acyl-CoA synthetase, putative [Plasmodium gallinaceum]|uniref:Acyl-CoA synthetase, putative n=1 Tax=Plasmodium gallinaceum TaxID=5849 RepID=A0A1J1GWV3_PLAGA|nr:acyl-CoA synthetase, putative [Plasmodium gallinaceum]CRG97025.1 acyl-CoA synthetase, putative [Plasmodium gallinaceum]